MIFLQLALNQHCLRMTLAAALCFGNAGLEQAAERLNAADVMLKIRYLKAVKDEHWLVPRQVQKLPEAFQLCIWLQHESGQQPLLYMSKCAVLCKQSRLTTML